ncbi:MAG: hypothetical protein NT045_01745, partial [Candidatus Aureabacteria bacterium]|nr:hypothetical protein [Candidatus Auribacterota bacterium]
MMEKIKESLGERVSDWEARHGRRFYCAVEPRRAIEVARELMARHGLRFITGSGVDTRSCVELLYHFS